MPNNDRRSDKSKKDYDGVIYEPSTYSSHPTRDKQENTQDYDPAQRSISRSASAPRRRKAQPQKSRFALFYVITLITAVTLCIVIFSVVFSSHLTKTSDPSTVGLPTESPAAPEDTNVAIEQTMQFTGFVESISYSAGQVKLLDFETGSIHTLTVDPKTKLSSRYGQAQLINDFKSGDIVDAVFYGKTNVLMSMSGSNDAWEHKQVRDTKIDVVEQTLSIGNEIYKFGRGFLVQYKGESYNIADIRPVDVCNLRGYKDTVWFVDVVKSHGQLVIIGKDDVVDGLLELDTDIFTMLSEFESLEVAEGSHRVVIKGLNVEPFVKEIEIVAGAVTTVDISEMQVKSGVLNLTVNESLYSLWINGELKNTGEPIVLPYGEYDVKVEKDEFEPWEGKLTVDSPTAALNITLEKIFKLARLTVTTEPDGAEIYLDNVLVGTSPVKDVPVEMGMHTVMARKDGYVSVTSPVDVNSAAHSILIGLQPREPLNELPAPPENTDETAESDTP